MNLQVLLSVCLNKHRVVLSGLSGRVCPRKLVAAAPTSVAVLELRATDTDPWVFMQMCLYLWVSCGSETLGLQQKASLRGRRDP